MLEKDLVKNPAFKKLCKAIASIKTEQEACNFLRDIATFNELIEMSERLDVADLLNQKISYRKIYGQTGVSTATVTRIAHWLHHGMGGYQMALGRL